MSIPVSRLGFSNTTNTDVSFSQTALYRPLVLLPSKEVWQSFFVYLTANFPKQSSRLGEMLFSVPDERGQLSSVRVLSDLQVPISMEEGFLVFAALMWPNASHQPAEKRAAFFGQMDVIVKAIAHLHHGDIHLEIGRFDFLAKHHIPFSSGDM